MARDTARLTGKSIMPPYSLTCPYCKKTFFMPGGSKATCPDCGSKEMRDRATQRTIFASDVKTKSPKKETEDAKTEDTKKIEGPTKGTRAPRHSRS